MITNRHHFVALDSLRGICALAVVLFHFRTEGIVSNLSFVQNSWMFVDFFFVLSGFVISAAYAERFARGGVTIGRFMGLRLGRIYPLHIAILFLMIVLEALLLTFDFSQVSLRQPFSGNRTLAALGTNLGLLNAFGLHSALTWNGPSWSIAAEMWMYLLFAIVFSQCGRWAWWVMMALGAGALIWLAIASPDALNATFALGFVRCAYGFSIGTGAFWLMSRRIGFGGSLAEGLTAGLTIAFVTLVANGLVTLIAPLVFALPVLAFARGEGRLSQLLCVRPLAWLGAISYSTYMVHSFVQARIGDVVKLFGYDLGLALRARSSNPDFPSEILSGAAWKLDLLTLGMVVIVICVGSLTYLWIEKPCRAWSRSLLAQSDNGTSDKVSARSIVQ